jgi:catalase-peroxidase
MQALKKVVSKTPQKLNLNILQSRNHGEEYAAYKKEFATLDMKAVKADIVEMLRTSQEWWPADYGHYGPFMVRLAWHSAGTYRAFDGRGGANAGNMRFNPLDSWDDNANLDKARRLLWPIKQKYGRKLSWGDLMILVGNVAMEDMGFKTFGFAGGRVDVWQTEEDVYWGTPDDFKGLARDPSQLEQSLGAVEKSLIYVNPEGPDGIPDPLLAAAHIRETFGRMAMNDAETVALIAGGHTFGKAHGAAPGGQHQGPKPSEANIEEQGFGWNSTYKSGKGADTITSGLEGAWTAQPTKWDNGFFENMFKYEWELFESAGGAKQWRPKGGAGVGTVPDAHDKSKTHQPIMFTTDLALMKDPTYLKISKKFHAEPATFADAFARAWYKLTHRDMGPVKRCLGLEVAPAQTWQDPVPEGRAFTVTPAHKTALLNCGLTVAQLVRTAWASACTFRHTDFRGGANGARIRLAPQNRWSVNNPEELATILEKYEAVQKKFAADKISLADLIVLGGCAAIEQAAVDAMIVGDSHPSQSWLEVPFQSGRGDATQENTDTASFAVLEPSSDAFRNYRANPYQMVDHAHMLKLSAPEMAVLVAGFRALGANAPQCGQLGVLTKTPGKLTNDFFVNLLDMSTEWKPKAGATGIYEGLDRTTKQVKWTASEADLAFGSNPELRAIAERYACDDAKEVFARDFAKAFAKVTQLDLF